MSGSRLLVGVASILAGTTVLLVVFGFVYNPILLVAAVPFAASTYFIWNHATGRLEARMRERARYRRVDGTAQSVGPDGPAGARGAPRDRGPWAGGAAPGRDRAADDVAAARVLGVAPDADEATIRAAFREQAKAYHPDAPEGDEAAFRRARAAYEQLTGRQ